MTLSTRPIPEPSDSDLARFWAKVDVRGENDCWEWTAAKSKGYGTLHVGGWKWKAHRLAVVWLTPERAEQLDGMTVDHLCLNPGCVNPAHLDIVSLKENTLRGDGLSAQNRRKTVCSKGHPLFGDNLYVWPSGRRRCRICRVASARRVEARNGATG